MDSKKTLTEWKLLAKKLARTDTQLSPLIAKVGPPEIQFCTDSFRALAESIVGQQLAPGAARAIKKRIADWHPPFPTAEKFKRARVETIRKFGVSRPKATYLKNLAHDFLDKGWDKKLRKMEDEAIIESLTQIKGVGTWTVHMYLIFALGRPNILPVGDYGVRRGVGLFFGMKEPPLPKELPALVKQWEGMYSVVSWYLWKSLDRGYLK